MSAGGHDMPHAAAPTRTRRSRWLRLAVGFAALAAFALSVQPLAQAQTVGSSTPQLVGTLPRFPADSIQLLGNSIKPAFVGDIRQEVNGTAIAVPQLNQLWQMYLTSTEGDATPTAIAVRDLTSLKIVKTLRLPLPARRAAAQQPEGDWLHATDGTKRIFFLSAVGATGTQGIFTVMEVDLQTYAVRQFQLGAPHGVVPGLRTLLPGAMEYDPYADSLMMLFAGFQGTSGAGAITTLYRLDLKTGQGQARLIRTCNGPLPPAEAGLAGPIGGIVRPDFVYFGCQRLGSIGAVVRLTRGQNDADLTNPVGREDIVSGPAYLETSFADPISGRLFLVTIAGEIWAFDIRTMAFVGVVAGGIEGQIRPRTGFGLDRATGRLFIQSETLGLGYAEGRFYPIPQARTFPALKAPTTSPIISDSKTGRIFVVTGRQNARDAAYKIYDVGQAPTPPLPPDPDQNTTDIEEQPGVTESRFFSSGTGYGVRVLMAKGFSSIPPQPAAGQQAPVADIIAKNLNSKCGFTDRELVVARVAKGEYDTGSTAAEAVGVDVDERTKLDLEHLSRCDIQAQNGNNRVEGLFSIFSTGPVVTPTHQPSQQEKDLREDLTTHCTNAQQDLNPTLGLSEDATTRECDSGKQWLTKNAFCTSSAGGESDGRLESEGEAPSSGTVECPAPGGRLKAEATGYLTGGLKVGEAHTETKIVRSAKGVVSTVISEAEDIDIAGVVNIGRITATARSASNGRPNKDEMSTYELVIKGVTLKNPVSNETTVLCEEYKSSQRRDNCDIERTIDTLNAAAAGRAEFRLSSGLDTDLRRGSPKGALTAVQKSTARQASDQALVGDRTTEVAGLELTVYNDNPAFGRARQVYQFAGVATAATYNITLLPSGLGFPNDEPFGEAGDLSGDAFDAAGGEVDGILPDIDDFPGGIPVASVSEEDGDERRGEGGGLIGRVVRAIGRGIRMFFANPRHALLLLTAWALFSLPPVLSRRRRLLADIRSE